MIDKSKEILLEPYTFINIVKNKVIFFNTLNNSIYESNNEYVLGFAKKILNEEVMSVLHIQDDVELNSEVIKCIDYLKANFMIEELINTNKKKPIVLKPIPKINKDFDKINTLDHIDHGSLHIYLHEIVLHINDYCTLKCYNCNDYYRQFESCYRGENNNLISFDKIISIVNQIPDNSVISLKITGGNIFKHPELSRIINYFSKSQFVVKYLVNINNIKLNDFKEFTDKQLNFIINICDYDDSTIEHFKQIYKYFINSQLNNAEFNFVVSDDHVAENIDNLLEKLNMTNYQFVPFYNGDNLNFFVNNVFVDYDDIIESSNSIKSIFSKKTINLNSFGKMTIKSNGEVFTNINDSKIGNINSDSLISLVFKELSSNKSWRNTRLDKKPCRECQYNLLCPSISDYEYALNRFNLCNIN